MFCFAVEIESTEILVYPYLFARVTPMALRQSYNRTITDKVDTKPLLHTKSTKQVINDGGGYFCIPYKYLITCDTIALANHRQIGKTSIFVCIVVSSSFEIPIQGYCCKLTLRNPNPRLHVHGIEIAQSRFVIYPKSISGKQCITLFISFAHNWIRFSVLVAILRK